MRARRWQQRRRGRPRRGDSVPAQRITELNAEHRRHAEPTDVLSFPIDGVAPLAQDATREIGDVVICPEHTADLHEAVIHGMLHLLGMDHEVDGGEMLALQGELLERSRARARERRR